MRFDVLTLFPEIFEGFRSQGLIGQAVRSGLIDLQLRNIRDWALDRRGTVDDKPFGGGPGMLMMCQPIFDCVESVQAEGDASGETSPGRLLVLTPQGRRLDQGFVTELAAEKRLLLLCGRYEGFDQRVIDGLKPTEVSVGDFICNGGEVPAMVIIEAVSRLIPGVLGDEESHRDDSFNNEGRVEFPQYTRPREFRGMMVPEILLSGNHQAIAEWRRNQSAIRTQQRLVSDTAPESRTGHSESEDPGIGQGNTEQ